MDYYDGKNMQEKCPAYYSRQPAVYMGHRFTQIVFLRFKLSASLGHYAALSLGIGHGA